MEKTEKAVEKKEYTVEVFEKMKCSECVEVENGREYLYNSRCRTCQRFRRGCSYIH